MRERKLVLKAILASMALLAAACTADDPATERGATSASVGAGGAAAGGGGGSTGPGGSGLGGSGGAPDADKAASCADTFGDALTDSFGRLDGPVLAVVAPTDTQCTLPNDDHLVIQVTMGGAAYRMVVNVADVYLAEKDAPLAGAPWAEGWHTDVSLDYATVLDAHGEDFAPHSMEELVALVSAPIEIGAPISVYATSSGGTYASSAHLVHRNAPGADGAIVVDPMAASPHYLLFRFANQSF